MSSFKMVCRSMLVACVGMSLLGCSGERAPEAAAPPPAPAVSQILIHGGPIYTGVEEQPQVEAILIDGNAITYAGDLDEAQALALETAEVIDLAGAAAFPGFVDAHAHMAGIGLSAVRLELAGTPSIADLQQRLALWAEQNPTGAIQGRGWIETHWPEGRFPTRQDLDAVVADRPVYLVRADGHAAVANTVAIELAGIDRDTPDTEGGRIERDADGDATGMLIDHAQSLVSRQLPAPTIEQRRTALKAAGELYASRGWTGMQDLGADWRDLGLLEDLAANGELAIRVDSFIRRGDAEDAFRSGQRTDASGLVRLRGVKLLIDGALGSRGAALAAPYSDAPDITGLVLIQPGELADLLARARESGVQVAIHAIGDRGNRLALDAIENAFGDDRGALAAARWRVEHAQILSGDDIPRFAGSGIIASMQPSHAIGDLHFAPARLGPDRLDGAYAWRTLLDGGAIIAGGSDAPVEVGDPLIEFYAAVHRHDLQGYAGPDWHLDEAVDRDAALRMFTWAPAFAAGDEASRGTLEAGKRADVSVFSNDLLTVEPSAIPESRALLTIVDGRVVHRADP